MNKIFSVALICSQSLSMPFAKADSYINQSFTGVHKFSGDDIKSSSVEDNGIVTISDNSTASDMTILGTMNVIESSITESTVSGGALDVRNGTTDRITLSSGTFNARGGLHTNNVIENTSYSEFINADVRNTIISGFQGLKNTKADNTQILKDGIQSVQAGSVTTKTLVNGGSQSVYANGVANGTEVISGSQTIYDGGIANETVVKDVGKLYVEENGRAKGATLFGTGLLSVLRGQAENIKFFENSRGIFTIGSTVNSIELNGNSSLEVWNGATSNLTVNDNAYAEFQDKSLLDGASINGGEVMIGNGAMVTGGIKISNVGVLIVDSNANSEKANVSVAQGGSLVLRNALLNSDLSINSLSMTGGDVLFNSDYLKLSLNSLDGNGNFYMRTNVGQNIGDFINVTGSAMGSFKIFINDQGHDSPSKEQTLQIAKIANGNAAFALGNNGGMVDIGTWQYVLKEETKGSWVLTQNIAQKPDDKPEQKPDDKPEQKPDDKPEQGGNFLRRITPSTAAVLNMAAVEPLVFDAELDSVRERMNGRDSFERDTSVWSTAYNTRNDAHTSAGAGFDQTLSGLTIGADRTFQMQNSTATAGGFFSYSHSNVGFDRGGKGDVDSYSLGAYASWQHHNGLYVDGIVKANRFENDVKGRMTSGGAANGSYSAYGAGAHLETGMRYSIDDLSVTPYAALTGFTTDSNKYTLSNGMRAEVDNTRIMRAEAGLKAGYRVVMESGVEIRPWVKASVRQEYADDNKIKVNDDGRFVNDLSGTRGVYQAGIHARFTEDLSGHLSASYGNGANVESPWRAAAGITWSF